MLKALPAVGAMDGPDVPPGFCESTDDFLDDHVAWDGVSLPPDTKRTSLSRASSLTSLWPGDSIAGSVSGGDGEDRSGGEPKSAVAVGPRNTYPQQGQAQQDEADNGRRASDVLNNREDVGNVGFFFGNWGARPSGKVERDAHDLQIKRCPAQIVGLCECGEVTQRLLEEEVAPDAGGAAAAVAKQLKGKGQPLKNRRGYEYWTIRGDEPQSNLIAVRKSVGYPPRLLFWNRQFEGIYTTKHKKKGNAYSRCIIAEVNMKFNFGYFGNSLVVMVMHLHNKVANNDKGFRDKLKAFWKWLPEKLKQFEVNIFMGDLNMCLWKVCPELRSSGLKCDLMAWCPWKSNDGEPCSDSCGIWLIGKDAVVETAVAADRLHADTDEGILTRGNRGALGAV